MTKEVQNVHANDTSTCQASQETHSLANTKVVEHRRAEVDGSASQCRTRKVVASEKRCGVLWIGQGQIHEDALDNEEDADREDADTNNGANPVNVRAGSPCCGYVNRGKRVIFWTLAYRR